MLPPILSQSSIFFASYYIFATHKFVWLTFSHICYFNTEYPTVFLWHIGFELIQERLASSELDAPAYAALIAPFGNCAQYLNKEVVKPLLEPGLKSAVSFVQNLKSDDLKQKVTNFIILKGFNSFEIFCQFISNSIYKFKYSYVVYYKDHPAANGIII